MNVPIRRALLSVSDKTGIVALARALRAHGCELISTGGTCQALEEAGLPVTEIAQVTGNPEAFGGRMKTISFAIESALLFDRERDRDEARKLGIEPIDLVVCNLYPFARHAEAGADLPTLIENVDIGGPTMIRAAAKNHRWVAVATEPAQYPALERELGETGGALGQETRTRLMLEAFRLTADYDARVAVALGERHGERPVRLAFERGVTLRYGENPHQSATFYRERGAAVSLHDLRAHGGKELSYNNLVDAWAAIEVAGGLERFGCAVVKHSNPCGLAEAATLREALERAWAGDPVSSFGSVIAFNRPLERAAVEFLELDHPDKARRKFVEVIAAPGFEPAALEYLAQSKNLRAVEVDVPGLARCARTDYRVLPGALLAQTPDLDADLFEGVQTVTRRAPAASSGLVAFGLRAVRQLKSNAIAIVRQAPTGAFQLLGMGAGQPNRVNSTRLAVERAWASLVPEFSSEEEVRSELERAVLVSDAFFPFPDSIDVLAHDGIRIVFQPGGSVRDAEVIARCDELGVAMGLTGRRHFKH